MKSFLLLSFLFCSLGSSAQVVEALKPAQKVDFTHVEAEISIFPETSLVEGSVKYSFDILQQTDSIYIDAKNMEFKNVRFNGKAVKINNNGHRLWILDGFAQSQKNELELQYTAQPQQAMYFINWNVADSIVAPQQVWTQGQGRNTSNWLPSFDDMNEKAIFSLKVNFKEHFKVIANGELMGTKSLNDSIKQWHYAMEKPMSSYLVAIAAGSYEQENFETALGIPVALYYPTGEDDKVEPTYRYTKRIFEFLEAEIGVSYPWKNYKQVPVQDFLYSGMENTGTTIFSSALMVDSTAYKDQNYVNVNAHELAHQWFGNLVTSKNGDHHWLHEGFATYYALLAEREVYGVDYYYWKLFQTAEELKDLSDQGKGEALINSKAGSLTYYQKGAWALHILKEKVGEEAFKQGVIRYLEQNAYQNVTTDDFLSGIEKASGIAMDGFKNDWLLQSAFQGTEALNSLKKSNFIRSYMELAALREYPLSSKKAYLTTALDFPVNDYIGQEVVFQLSGENIQQSLPLYKKAFESGNLYVRQAIALSVDTVPEELKPIFIGLLKDDSYLTKENTLLKLWLAFPEETHKWLKNTEGIDGLSNKNVRMLWLVINLVSPEVDPEKSREYYEELSGFTRGYVPFEVRQNAFGYLYQINAFTRDNLVDLVKAGQHHIYRFRDFSRKLLDQLLGTEEYREKFRLLSRELSGKDRDFLETRLKSINSSL